GGSKSTYPSRRPFRSQSRMFSKSRRFQHCQTTSPGCSSASFGARASMSARANSTIAPTSARPANGREIQSDTKQLQTPAHQRGATQENGVDSSHRTIAAITSVATHIQNRDRQEAARSSRPDRSDL